MSKLLALIAFSLPLLGQIATLPPSPHTQFLDASGHPLSGGKIYTCVASTSCPGNPLATYTDSSATVQNANPVLLDASGFANIWIGGGNYKFVAQSSKSVQQWTQDNISSLALILNAKIGVAGGIAQLDSNSFVLQSELNYNAGLSGQANRPIKDKLAQVVSPKDFGAAGDGATNDTVAFQAALNAGASVVDGEGKTYLVSNLLVQSNTTVQNASLKVAGGSAIPISGLTIDGLTVAKTNIVFRRITVDGNRKNMSNFGSPSDGDKSCFRIVGTVSNVLVDNVTGSFCGTDGLQLFSYTRPATDNDSDLRFHNITVRNSTFKYNRRSGISLDSAFNVSFLNVTAEYNGLDEDEVQSIYNTSPSMADVYDWQSGSYTPHATCLAGGATGDCAAKTTANKYYQNGIDVEGYGVGSAVHMIHVIGCHLLRNATGGLQFIDSTTTSTTGFVIRQGIAIIGNVSDIGLHSSDRPWPYAINVDGPAGEYSDVTITGNIATGLVSLFGASGAAVTGNRIIISDLAYAIFTGSSLNLEVMSNATDGKGINFFDSLGSVNQETFMRTATTTEPATISNYAVLFGGVNTPLAVGAFTAFDSLQTFGVPLAINAAGQSILLGTTTNQSGKVQVAGTFNVQQDTSGSLQLGRFSAANPYVIINAEDNDGSTPSGFAFSFSGAAAAVKLLPNGVLVPAQKSNSGTRYACFDINGMLISQTTACSGT